MSKIYIIIVTYNGMKWAEKCFSSLRNSSVPVQTIVIDNGSTDGTPNFIKTQFPEVELIASTKNLGFGKANNLGIEKAYKNGADFFYLMNQDAWLYQDSLEKLLKVYESYDNKEEIGILSPMHLDGSEKKLDIFLDKYIAQNFESRIISDFFCDTVKPFYEISFVNAAHWFLPKHTIEQIGGFNPYFFHYGEDAEYANRIKFHGKKIILVTESKVVHDGKQNLSKVDYNKYDDLIIETKILNPSVQNNTKAEQKSLLLSMIKSAMLGKFGELTSLRKKHAQLSKDSKLLNDLSEKIKIKGTHFLHI